MVADSDGTTVEAREAFALLGHEIRLDILLALLDDWVAAYTEPTPYAELMDAVGVRDSGKFNYHLEKLRGVYVRKVDGGYVPTASATALYRAVLAHRPMEPFEYEPSVVDTTCPACGSSPRLRYDRGFVTVRCDDCSEWAGFSYPFPRNGFESRDPAALLDAIHALVRHDVGLAREGLCPGCAGATTVDLRLDALEAGEHRVDLTCDTCTFVVGIDVLAAVSTDDRVTSALRRVGVDVDRYLWEAPAGTTRVESREPPVLAFEVEGEADAVAIVVDHTLDVRSVTVE